MATPHAHHEAMTLLFVEAGKHVLCEKPFALNARQAQRMVDAARAQGVFCMEAMWSRFLPAYRVLVDVLGEGRIGEPLLVEADFGYRTPVVPDDRHFDLHQGGGALLDLGIYPVQLCTLVLGLPDRVAADGIVGSTGVDEQVAAVLHHPGDRLGVVKAALQVSMSCTARIAGTDGWIELPAFMHCPESLDVAGPAGLEHIDAALRGRGPALPGRRGAPLPRRGADREPGHAAGRDRGHRRRSSTTSGPRSASSTRASDRAVGQRRR